MSSMKMLVGLLSHLKASGGEIETRIRLQKEEFLLGLLCKDMFDIRDFEYHHFGPYNRGLSETLQFAVTSELVDEIDVSPADRAYTKFRYSLTDEGRNTIHDIHDIFGNNNDLLDKWAKKLKEYDWRTLELAATTKFLEINENLDPESALQEALRLKPKTAASKNNAKDLLADLSSSVVT